MDKAFEVKVNKYQNNLPYPLNCLNENQKCVLALVFAARDKT